ncbi:MAG TPA: aminomethyl-transferring glycine dehydrogenase subunit GcvPB [Brevefilum fermentans]|jgi:glycine dehydrogenase subunit 2|uniref:Probable glycine dehydrogenase (decarboxylating) subunit 2 n=1 Tax=Candidatus Brevifilum fermentans TaxID=1986204 RepID=A0A1Y6K3Z4_9CHLR|nr:aminomethyl-transferring glycine dehydrogenase subunit GcvPB [Brevefilum fermentans]MDI9567078.1 aminomethyl-transferring glycine dehydrogenase subunit GcvPB [Chloroflexota bacterium]SMX54334.1 putative glycine dehydrogenase (decarboxylating) subunit 2 [Brevefilum fermentans]HQA29491.1 aminomethyl-transferring glycine dehydrogenase subunit GcvPB [Brevefilum fermentans]
MTEKTIYELSQPGRKGFTFPASDVPSSPLPKGFEREAVNLPELSELDVIRHFTNLSHLNHSVDGGFYPLGSCTMKYNPKINEVASRLPGFSQTHPLQPITSVQGNLYLMYQLQEWIQEISGFHKVSLTPAAGAHGELVGALIIKKYHEDNNETQRVKILIPDSAHGTNPATSSMSGFVVVPLPSDERGNVDLDALKSNCDETLAGLMLTNPNTLGLFDENVVEVIEMVHTAGGLVYGDGANLNALLGILRPGDVGFDIMHFNLHKTFSTPHGGGGPGSGPVGVSESLAEYLPGPIVTILDEGDEENPPFYGLYMPEKSIGRMKAFFGHFGVLVKAFTYIAMHGPDGLRDIGVKAVLNANYLMEKVKKDYFLPYDRICMHEFVVEGTWKDVPSVHALDISKRLIDYGFHPPTNYFPLIVHEALMVEPTETESKQTLDAFAAAMKAIAQEARENPELLTKAPHTAPIRRTDEVKAARDLVLCCWTPEIL